MELLRFRLLRLMGVIEIKAKVWGEILSSKGLLRLNVIDFSKKIKKTIAIFCFLNILYVTELPEVFLALGTKLRLVLSFFTLRIDFMDLKNH